MEFEWKIVGSKKSNGQRGIPMGHSHHKKNRKQSGQNNQRRTDSPNRSHQQDNCKPIRQFPNSHDTENRRQPVQVLVCPNTKIVSAETSEESDQEIINLALPDNFEINVSNINVSDQEIFVELIELRRHCHNCRKSAGIFMKKSCCWACLGDAEISAKKKKAK